MVVNLGSEMPIVKLLHFSRAQEVCQGSSVTAEPLLDLMEFEGKLNYTIMYNIHEQHTRQQTRQHITTQHNNTRDNSFSKEK